MSEKKSSNPVFVFGKNTVKTYSEDHSSDAERIQHFPLEIHNYTGTSLESALKRIVQSTIKEEAEKLTVSLFFPNFTLFPDELFSKELAKDMCRTSMKIPSGCMLIDEKINGSGITLAYPLNFEIYRQFLALNKRVKIQHLCTTLIQTYTESLNKEKLQDALFLYLFDEEVFLCAFKKGKLQLANKFSFLTPEDLLYFVLLGIETAGLYQTIDKVFYSGNIDQGGVLHEILKKYTRHLSPLPIQFLNDKQASVKTAADVDIVQSN